MSKVAELPAISVAFDMDEGVYRIYASSYGQTTPAGERLFRGHPWPVVQFVHAEEAAALRDARTLREYLADCAAGKRKDKEPARRGWWD